MNNPIITLNKNGFPDSVLIGEAWMMGISLKELKTINIRNKYIKWLKGQAPESLFEEYIGELDGVLDFKFQNIICNFVANKITKEKVISKLQRHYKRFPPDFYLPTFLDNHDTDRFLYRCHNNKELLKSAVEIQFSINQPKIIYYGTETGISQEKSIFDSGWHADLQARKPMKWENQDKELFDFYRNIISSNS